MPWLLPLLLLLVLAGAGALAPVYEFYAYRHAVPMWGKDYVRIPDHAPQNDWLHVASYAPAAEIALQRLEAHRRRINSPGISAAVAVDGELVWAGASGWADIRLDRALTPASQFRIGSTSKALTATLLARLVDAGALDLDTPLSRFRIGRLNPQWRDITPRQLASHMAGIPHYKQNSDWRGLYRSMTLDRHFDDVADSVLLFDTSDTLFAPGEAFEYSSLGTVLLSAVMQEAAGKPFQQVLREEVLKPLQMERTLPEPEASLRREEVPELATFYWHPDSSTGTVVAWREVDLSHRLAGGGFLSTSSDLVRLGLGFNATGFITDETRSAFWTPQVLNSGEVNEQHYAIGWRVRESDFGEDLGTLFQANHGGVSRGAQSWLMVIPRFQMAVAVNINAKTEKFWDFADVSYELVRLFLQARSLPHEEAVGAATARATGPRSGDTGSAAADESAGTGRAGSREAGTDVRPPPASGVASAGRAGSRPSPGTAY